MILSSYLRSDPTLHQGVVLLELEEEKEEEEFPATPRQAAQSVHEEVEKMYSWQELAG